MAKKISVIIPVLNEATVIGHTLQQFSSQRSGSWPHEIVVVDADADGSTLKAITEPEIIKAVAPRGRAAQMNHGANLATGDIFLFLHADTLLPPMALPTIAASLSRGSADWGAFDLGIASNRHPYRIIEAAVLIRTLITRIPYGDQAVFLTRDLFYRTGGFPKIPIMEDVALVRRIKKMKAAGCRIPEKVRTSPRRWESEGIVFCTLRNWLLVVCYYIGVHPEILSKYYRSK